ncbi:MAG: hypothetical protein HY319_24295 [Armatimonadetes bacterium]|nr:hypothetical protein [Armatimonadota bacterium]
MHDSALLIVETAQLGALTDTVVGLEIGGQVAVVKPGGRRRTYRLARSAREWLEGWAAAERRRIGPGNAGLGKSRVTWLGERSRSTEALPAGQQLLEGSQHDSEELLEELGVGGYLRP